MIDDRFFFFNSAKFSKEIRLYKSELFVLCVLQSLNFMASRRLNRGVRGRGSFSLKDSAYDDRNVSRQGYRLALWSDVFCETNTLKSST